MNKKFLDSSQENIKFLEKLKKDILSLERGKEYDKTIKEIDSFIKEKNK